MYILSIQLVTPSYPIPGIAHSGFHKIETPKHWDDFQSLG